MGIFVYSLFTPSTPMMMNTQQMSWTRVSCSFIMKMPAKTEPTVVILAKDAARTGLMRVVA